VPTANPARIRPSLWAIWVLLAALLAACSGQLSAKTYRMLTHDTALAIAEQTIPAMFGDQPPARSTAR